MNLSFYRGQQIIRFSVEFKVILIVIVDIRLFFQVSKTETGFEVIPVTYMLTMLFCFPVDFPGMM